MKIIATFSTQEDCNRVDSERTGEGAERRMKAGVDSLRGGGGKK